MNTTINTTTTQSPNFIEPLRGLSNDAEMPSRRLRRAVLLQAFDDVRQGGRNGSDARRWLLSNEATEGALNAQDLMEEAGLDVSQVRRNLRQRTNLGLRAA
ncbi:MAG: hypothetical protein P8R42_18725 [Candidatus Binatia bacterium]|nr:hypothetical protein [Candidatus Binatia bacterium]